MPERPRRSVVERGKRLSGEKIRICSAFDFVRLTMGKVC